MYSMAKHVELISVKVYQFLNLMLVKGELSIPPEFLLPFEDRVAGQNIHSDPGNRLKPEKQDDTRA